MFLNLIKTEWVKLSKLWMIWVLLVFQGILSFLLGSVQTSSGSSTYFNGVASAWFSSFLLLNFVLSFVNFWLMCFFCIIQGQIEYRNNMSLVMLYMPVKQSLLIFAKCFVLLLFMMFSAFSAISIYGVSLYFNGISITEGKVLHSGYSGTLGLQGYLMLRMTLVSFASIVILMLINLRVRNLMTILLLTIALCGIGTILKPDWFPFSFPRLSSSFLLKNSKDIEVSQQIFSLRFFRYEYLSLATGLGLLAVSYWFSKLKPYLFFRLVGTK
jgi:ABC-2 family transporter protein